MASLQVDRASPLEDVTETEATSKEAKTVLTPPPPPENVKPVDVEEDLDDLTAAPYQEKVGNSDDAEYLSYMAREEAAPPFTYGEGPATFDDFSEDEDDV